MKENKLEKKQLISTNINKCLIISFVIFFKNCGLAKNSLAANGDELNTVQNCTAPTGVTEANVTTGWTNAACSSMISDTDDPQLGSYDLKAVTHTTFGCIVNFLYPTLTEGTTYKLTIYAKIATGTQSWACYWHKLQHETIGPKYTKGEQIFHGDSSARVHCYENSPYSTGDAIHIDNLSVTPVTPCFGSETDTVSQAVSPVNEAN